MSELPPILQIDEVTPSAEQYPAVLNRGDDVVVTAGAGAGKTRTLVGRYVLLLADGYPLRSIVAITFTRKAAREMRIRIRQVVRSYQTSVNFDAETRYRWQELYLALDSARIGTIHSLCADIIRAHPAEAGIDPAFTVLDEAEAGLLQQQALNAGMALAASHEDLAELYSVYGERNLRRTLEDLLRQRLDAERAFNLKRKLIETGKIEAVWQHQIKQQRELTLSRLFALPSWQDATAILYAEQASDPADRAELQRRSIVDTLKAYEKTNDFVLLQAIGEIKLTGGKAAAWPGGAAQRNAVKGALRSLRELWKDYSSEILRSFNVLDTVLVETLPKLMCVFETTVNHNAILKEQQNVMDFDDLEISALNLLQTHHTVRERWQRELRAILVDEFQDTNDRQRDIVDLLNGSEHKLFIVGDGKQSIYGFRGADVSVFREKRAQIEQTGQHYVLTESYRAHRELITMLNACLKPVLGESEIADSPWIEPFAPLTYVREEARGCESPYVELHLTAGSKVDGALDLAADILVSRVKYIIDNAEEPLTYDDVVILCRASTSFSAYEDALDRAGIPYNTVSGRGFYQRPEIRDVLNALKALADPTDDAALVGLLRSPACGLSDMVIYQLLKFVKENDNESLWAHLCRPDFTNFTGDVSSDDLTRIERARDLITALLEVVGRVTVADLLKQFLDRTDYRAALMQAGSSRSVHNITKLLSDAHNSGKVGVSTFLNYVKSLKDSGSREGEAAIMSEGAVRIMTVHAAKGLEFGIVVIGDVGRRELNRNSLLIDDQLGVLPVLSSRKAGERSIKLPAVYEMAREREKEKALAESNRMLYVAATRAKEKLILSGTARINKQGTLSLAGWLNRIAGEQGLDLSSSPLPYDVEGEAAHQMSIYVGRDEDKDYPVGCFVYEPGYHVISRTPTVTPVKDLSGKPPYPLMSPLDQASIIMDEATAADEREPPRLVWRVTPVDQKPRVPGWVVGVLVHKALARWLFPDKAGFYDWVEALTKGYGVTDKTAVRYAISSVTRIMERFRSSSVYDDMAASEVRLTEVPYTIISDAGQVEYGSIDALYKIDNVWHMVEYKTDFVRNTEMLHALLQKKDYIRQIERYLTAVEFTLGQRPYPNLCFLNYGGSVLSITDRW